MPDPFLITGPAVISVSGGRTSGYMLWRILQAHGGVLPDDVVPLFENTGREMDAALDFVRDIGAAWNVPIIWLEYRREDGRPISVVVSHNSASRRGEPFEAMLSAKQALPNPVARFCTIELKIRTAERFVRRELGWDRWISVVGLRADEGARVERTLARAASTKDRWTVVCPLAAAGIQEHDVFAFWRRQAFDLKQRGRHEGNCDGCFLKNRGAITRMMAEHPERMAWWAAQEAVPRGNGRGATWRADRENYATLARVVRDQGVLPYDIEDSVACADAVCGV